MVIARPLNMIGVDWTRVSRKAFLLPKDPRYRAVKAPATFAPEE
jgi:hypothetical protein